MVEGSPDSSLVFDVFQFVVGNLLSGNGELLCEDGGDWAVDVSNYLMSYIRFLPVGGLTNVVVGIGGWGGECCGLTVGVDEDFVRDLVRGFVRRLASRNDLRGVICMFSTLGWVKEILSLVGG